MKHIVCYSGGHSSALVAIEVCRKYGNENVILVNHECKTEHEDVERFENQVARYLNIPITYASYKYAATKDQFDICIEKEMFVYANHSRELICTSILKTEPFMKWLSLNFPTIDTLFYKKADCIVYYGFDANEITRIQRRSSIMAANGYKTAFPLATWERTILSTNEIGIAPPNAYNIFKHANCIGCLKAGWQHWYAVYVLYPNIYDKAELSEEIIGFTIHKSGSLKDKRELFERMVLNGIEPTEKIPSNTWWSLVRKILNDNTANMEEDFDEMKKPCECYS